MKKIIFVLALMVLVTSCTVIDPQYTGKRIRVEPREYYDETPYYRSYYSPYYSSYMWSGWYGWWSPYWLYGYYSYYGPYNPYFWSWYNYGYPRGRAYSGRTVITKRQLSKGSVRSVPRSRISRGSTRKVHSSGTRSSISRSGSRRSAVSRGSSSRGSSSRVKKK
ncbi:MAG: hypothetical protein PVF22_07440 [Candidatus Aminicenantes bacterium]